MSLLSIKNLNVSFKRAFETGNDLKAIRDFSLDLEAGERIGIVGESGAGKSLAAYSILNLLKRPGYIESGEIVFEGTTLNSLGDDELNKIRGNRLSMIFQDPMVTLNPLITVGDHLVETLLAHKQMDFKEAKKIAIETLEEVKIPSPEMRFNQYPHEFSGGMRQRIVIACAIITKPQLIIADEPTTALDVTIQAEIMELLFRLSKDNNMALILITHDLALVSQIAEKIYVMYAGKIIEANKSENILSKPSHPYTRGLIECLPQKHDVGEKLYQIPGIMPTLEEIPNTCAFYPRCEKKQDRCSQEEVAITDTKSGKVRCFYPN